MVDPVLSGIIDQIEKSPLAQHAQKIGMLCIMWAQLEFHIDSLLLRLLANPQAQTAGMLVSQMDLRNKIAALRTIGFDQSPNKKWYSELEKELNTIDNDLRPARNRVVHDSWYKIGDDVYRLWRNAKVIKEQPRTQVLKLWDTKPVTLSDLMVLQIKVLAASGQIDALTDALKAHQTSRGK